MMNSNNCVRTYRYVDHWSCMQHVSLSPTGILQRATDKPSCVSTY